MGNVDLNIVYQVWTEEPEGTVGLEVATNSDNGGFVDLRTHNDLASEAYFGHFLLVMGVATARKLGEALIRAVNDQERKKEKS